VQAGMPGGAQKLTAQLVDPSGRVVGFLKCGESPLAQERLRLEHHVLSQLPIGLGPRALKFGPLGSFDALLIAPVEGRHLPSSLPPPHELTTFLQALHSSRTLTLEDHPWFARLGEKRVQVTGYIEALAPRSWPVVVQHGDLAPWNILRSRHGTLVAIDWEYGRLDGFPGLDLAQYVLQVSMLIKRCRPTDAHDRAASILERDRSLAVDRKESLALVALAAFEAHSNAAAEGISFDDSSQRWRRAIWQRSA
jgi:Phosphotransferase enzyme family